MVENIQHTSFTYIFIWVRKLDSNSLTKKKNWSGRNEVTETSGRLHPLWPQNKWLHTPRTTDYRHTKKDRWIQTELAFTLAKNTTKPNPFEIIPLQTTRKENNCKTKEALAQAAVTLETERIKGSNPWCLWWWWWWFIYMRRFGVYSGWIMCTCHARLAPLEAVTSATSRLYLTRRRLVGISVMHLLLRSSQPTTIDLYWHQMLLCLLLVATQK